jgi:hypothetical protein
MKLLTTFLPAVLYFPFTVCTPLEGTSVANPLRSFGESRQYGGTRRNRFLLSAVFDAPVGQNRKFLSRMNRISDLALGGWSVSTVSLWETGPYLMPTTSSSFDPAISTFPFAAARSARIASATTTSRMPQPEACSTSLRSIRFLMAQRKLWCSHGTDADADAP